MNKRKPTPTTVEQLERDAVRVVRELQEHGTDRARRQALELLERLRKLGPAATDEDRRKYLEAQRAVPAWQRR